MRIHYLPAYEYQRQRWKNGLGWTREIARGPSPGDDYEWRLSIAEISQACPFSAFPGYQRTLVLLDGNGMRLRFADGRETLLEPPHGRIDFSGDQPLDCELLDGPTCDFNLIYRPDRLQAELHHRPLVGSMVFFPSPGGDWFVYLLSGWAQVKNGAALPRLSPGDTLQLTATAASADRVILDGAGEVLVIRLAPSA